MSSILLSPPHMSGDELEFVNQAFSTNWIAPLGPNVEQFEKIVADYVGVKSALALSSGTAAIHLALCLLNVGPGDTVFCSSFTFVASANPILYQGATPVFIDSDIDSWNMSADALRQAFQQAEQTDKLPKAVIVVNLYGQSARFREIKALCDHYGVPIIEDAAESLGAYYCGKASGSWGKLGVFSFNGNKIITTSGGGMLVSDDEDYIEKARHLSAQSKLNAPYYSHGEIGFNYRLSNVLAGIGIGQMQVLDERVRARRQVFERYVTGLSELSAIQWMPEFEGSSSSRWLSACVIDPKQSELSPETVIQSLHEQGIEARRLWNPMHRQALFSEASYFSDAGSVSDYLFQHGLCLPSGSCLSWEQQQRVIRVLKDVFNA